MEDKITEDMELVGKVKAGETEAFRRLVEKYQGMVYALSYRMTYNRQEAEDLTQNSFVRMYRGIANYSPQYKFSTWAYTVTLNEARNHLARKKLLRFMSLEAFTGAIAEPEPVPVGLYEALELAVKELPSGLREVFILRHFQNNSIEDTAQIAGLSKNAVNIKLSRARGCLAARLAPSFPEYFKEIV